MIVNVNSVSQINIQPEDVFRILCQALQMDIILLEDADVYVKKDEFGDNCVYSAYGKYDDRGDLFIALRNVAVNMSPNVYFRSADYIYNT